MTPESPVETVPSRIVSDNSFLDVYTRETQVRRRGGVASLAVYMWEPKRIIFSLLIGIVAGSCFASFHSSEGSVKAEETLAPAVARTQVQTPRAEPAVAQIQTPRVSKLAPIERSVSVPVENKEELARIKARNRRLEALVLVLRQRKNTQEKKTSQDPVSLLGQ